MCGERFYEMSCCKFQVVVTTVSPAGTCTHALGLGNGYCIVLKTGC